MKLAELIAQSSDTIQNVVEQELKLKLTGNEDVKIEAPFKKTTTTTITKKGLFKKEQVDVTERIVKRTLDIDKICYDVQTDTIVIKTL
jgi:hypothetical protein